MTDTPASTESELLCQCHDLNPDEAGVCSCGHDASLHFPTSDDGAVACDGVALARPTPASTESELRAAADGVDAAWHDEGDHIEYHPELAERLMALRAALGRSTPAVSNVSEGLLRSLRKPPAHGSGRWAIGWNDAIDAVEAAALARSTPEGLDDLFDWIEMESGPAARRAAAEYVRLRRLSQPAAEEAGRLAAEPRDAKEKG